MRILCHLIGKTELHCSQVCCLNITVETIHGKQKKFHA